MLVDFDALPSDSKIYIYQSSRKFYPQEIVEITLKIESFLESWTDQETKIKTGYVLKYNRFLIVAVDTSVISLSVNAIDTLVGFIFTLQATYEVELIDKLNVSFKQGEFVQYKDLKEFQKLIKKRSISDKTIVFNNLINTKEEFENNWEVPITESWHSRFLK